MSSSCTYITGREFPFVRFCGINLDASGRLLGRVCTQNATRIPSGNVLEKDRAPCPVGCVRLIDKENEELLCQYVRKTVRQQQRSKYVFSD